MSLPDYVVFVDLFLVSFIIDYNLMLTVELMLRNMSNFWLVLFINSYFKTLIIQFNLFLTIQSTPISYAIAHAVTITSHTIHHTLMLMTLLLHG